MPRKRPVKRSGPVLTKVTPPPVAPAKPAQPEVDTIANLKGEILQLVAAANTDAVSARAEVGKKLLDVKVELKHGQWLPWLEANVPFTAATAKRAIQLWHFSQNDAATFAKLRPLGLTKAYKLMAMAPEERDAFLAKAHAVPGLRVRLTPLEMTFEQMMLVLHPPKPETKLLVTTKLVRSIRRQTLGLGRLLGSLWKLVPSFTARTPVKQALSVLAHELDVVVDALADKSLIEGSVAPFR